MLDFSGQLLVYRTITGMTRGGAGCFGLSLSLFYIFGPSFVLCKVGVTIVWIKDAGF